MATMPALKVYRGAPKAVGAASVKTFFSVRLD